MKINVKEKKIVTREFHFTLSEDEFNLLLYGIGSTSQNSREDAGMTKEQSKFFVDFYSEMANAKSKQSSSEED